MARKACKDSSVVEADSPKYRCKKCEATVLKEKHVCKPKKIKD